MIIIDIYFLVYFSLEATLLIRLNVWLSNKRFMYIYIGYNLEYSHTKYNATRLTKMWPEIIFWESEVARSLITMCKGSKEAFEKLWRSSARLPWQWSSYDSLWWIKHVWTYRNLFIRVARRPRFTNGRMKLFWLNYLTR